MSAQAVGQLDIFEAMARREAGQGSVIANSDADYREKLSNAIRALAARGEPFCSDDIRLAVGDPPAGASPNLVGALVNHALRSGLIHTIRWTRSSRVAGHGNLVGLYVGVRQ